jgi:leucyl aminopeptidase
MDFLFVDEAPVKHSCRVLVVGCFEDLENEPYFSAIDQSLGGALRLLYERKEFTGGSNKVKSVDTLGRVAPERLLLVGLGKRKDLSGEKMRQACGAAAQALRLPSVDSCSAILPGGPSELAPALEGFALGAYGFDRYKSKKEDIHRIRQVSVLSNGGVSKEDADGAISAAKALTDAVAFSRDLVSQPGNVATPEYLAEKGLEIAESQGLTCTVWDSEELERQSMSALLAVARGSHQSPKFIILEYNGGRKELHPTVIVGKGITFDSGGISLKPREGMEKMKHDMAGAAAVMGTMMALAALGLPVNVVGLIPAAENMPGGGSYRPGDVVTTMSGKTVEIVNTDAEGRLILCDALNYATQLKPAAIIDLATLTGACVVALGEFATGLFGNDDRLKKSLKEAGETTGERLWELPLWEDYGDLMKSDIADMKNSGGPYAGAISAAWFLKNYVGKAKWAHLDIAGTAWEDKGKHYLPKGATGMGVRLLVEYFRKEGSR